MRRTLPLALAFAGSLLAQTAAQESPLPATGLLSRFAADVSTTTPWPEHPRPRFVRGSWATLNGRWELTIVPAFAGPPTEFDREILVPFPIESALSGVGVAVGPDREAIYRKTFVVPAALADDERLVLHFEAVDWRADVTLNGRRLGSHEGGYDPFSFDVTGIAHRDDPNELVVRVWDPSDRGTQPCGKQTVRPRGIWYTPVTGIWGSVWLESTAARHLADVDFTTDRETGAVTVEASGQGLAGATLQLTVDGFTAAGPADRPLDLVLRDAEPWTPESPKLYDCEVRLIVGGEVVDRASTYFAFRDVGVVMDDRGTPRLALNGTPRFHKGLLDQGYWPDGLYTPPTDAALRYDVEVAKDLGFDTLRKHVKVEPRRWYTWCDRLGVLVWQDMPSGGPRIGADDDDLRRDAQERRVYERELRAMLRTLRHHPSIVGWVVFNEGWGQHETARYADLVRELDPHRLVDAVSGWADRGVGDVLDVHRYPGPGSPSGAAPRAAFLGEFGGLGLPVDDHVWQDRANWGYRSFDDAAAWNDALIRLIDALPALRAEGLTGAIYTQLTDVEIEVNGLLTYDRAEIKPDRDRLRASLAALDGPPPRIATLVPTSERDAQRWRYTFDDPGEGWTAPAFDDAGWREGPGGFGTPDTPGAVVGTVWDGPSIWLRRTVEIPAGTAPDGLQLRLAHDEDVTVYLDGAPILTRDGWSDGYLVVPLDAAAARRFTPGTHTLAVHCTQTAGGQFVDVGLVRVVR